MNCLLPNAPSVKGSGVTPGIAVIACVACHRCTAVTAVLFQHRLLVANAGDSRAVLSRAGQGEEGRAGNGHQATQGVAEGEGGDGRCKHMLTLATQVRSSVTFCLFISLLPLPLWTCKPTVASLQTPSLSPYHTF